MTQDEKLIHVYQEFMALTDQLLGDNVKALEVAPILIKLGLEIYKTVLSEEDYESIVELIYNRRDEINNLRENIPELH